MKRMEENKLKKWKRTRKIGQFWFVLIYSISFGIVFSLILNTFFYISEIYLKSLNLSVAFSAKLLVFNFLIGFFLWLIIATLMWNKTEKEFQMSMDYINK